MRPRDRLEALEEKILDLADELADIRRRLLLFAPFTSPGLHRDDGTLVFEDVDVKRYEVLQAEPGRYRAAIDGVLPGGQRVRFEHTLLKSEVGPIVSDVQQALRGIDR